MIFSLGTAMAQVQVKGNVVDENGVPVIGASVVIQGTLNGTTTDLDGNFTLKAPKGAVLEISAIGYTKVAVQAAPEVKAVIKTTSEELDALVVLGYGSGKKISNISASVVRVSAKELKEKPTSNPFDAIQGKVAGLQVYTSSGEPSEISSMKLHGTGSLGASSTPLYILDGMPITSGALQ